jgi:hypothetical protein
MLEYGKPCLFMVHLFVMLDNWGSLYALRNKQDKKNTRKTEARKLVIKMNNSSFERVKGFKYLEITLTKSKFSAVRN